MRRTLFVLAVCAASLAAAPLAAAQPPAVDTGVQVRAVYGPEQFPIAGVTADITPCAGGPALPAVTTDATGAATVPAGAGCYRVRAGDLSGCAVDGDPVQQVSVVPGITAIATFRYRCA
ncbi:hypothetical protein [Nocardia sp. NPDC057668]|uniref:hypothetical protein n=1 Tax=Nocardia sp. NPDC057668 TaxID=3346202 RepID=UPI00366C1B47